MNETVVHPRTPNETKLVAYELVGRTGMLTMTVKGQIRLHTGTVIVVLKPNWTTLPDGSRVLLSGADVEHTPGEWRELPGFDPAKGLAIPEMGANRLAYRLAAMQGRRNVGKLVRWDKAQSGQLFVAGHVEVHPGSIIVVDDLANMAKTAGVWEHVGGALPVIEQFTQINPFEGATESPTAILTERIDGNTTRTVSDHETPDEKDEVPPGHEDVAIGDVLASKVTRTGRRS